MLCGKELEKGYCCQLLFSISRLSMQQSTGEFHEKSPQGGVHKSYGVHWTDILELNDAEEMAKRSAILVGLICFGFMGAASWMLF